MSGLGLEAPKLSHSNNFIKRTNMTNAVKPKSLIHSVMYWLGLIFLYIFYRVTWLEVEDRKGYFLLKRKWVWFIILPIMLIVAFSKATWITIADIFNYNFHWIREDDKNRKLSFKEKLSIGERLFY